MQEGGGVREAAVRSAGRGGFWLPYTDANKARATRGGPAQRRPARFPTPPLPARCIQVTPGCFSPQVAFWGAGGRAARLRGLPWGSAGQAGWRAASGANASVCFSSRPPPEDKGLLVASTIVDKNLSAEENTVKPLFSRLAF